MKIKTHTGVLDAKASVCCDECGEEFVLKPRDIKHREYQDGIHIEFFSCPFCGEKYVSNITDPGLRRLIKENSKVNVSGVRSPTSVMIGLHNALLEKYRGRVENE